MSGGKRRPRADGDLRDQYPLLAEWVVADRTDDELGARVVAWLLDYRRHRTTGPTWYALAEHVRPDLALVPDLARRWYASQLVNHLTRQGWLTTPNVQAGAGYLRPGPRAQRPAPPIDPADGVSSSAGQADPEAQWVPGRLF